ncbi:MAG: tryptophan 2,3-dioxygenase [Myxococcales bacterium]|nr:tryptophan 2,3-dioxygenase [Myxococcales bacterium]MCB9691723.1 tryptophan 2,3-dioxygenase [Alphaproteobacteria bacterium]
MRTTYWDYLNLDHLLTLQGGLEHDEDNLLPDELHFIIVHQTYELWFKLVIRSIRAARDRLALPRVDEDTIPTAVHHLRRVSAILRVAVHQFEVMETLSPQDFLAFRDKLVPSSGFQSFQMRELEILLGLERRERIQYGNVDPLDHIARLAESSPAGALAWSHIQRARDEESMLAVIERWLYRTPIQGSRPDDPNDPAVVEGFLTAYLAAMKANMDGTLERLVAALDRTDAGKLRTRFDGIEAGARAFLFAEDLEDITPEERAVARRVRAAILFIESYRELPLLAWPRLLLDAVVDMEEQLVIWRHRHVRMVERTIGRRVGTGGSDGVSYLDQTLSYRIFRDLWAVRTVMVPRDKLPALERPAFYGFAVE